MHVLDAASAVLEALPCAGPHSRHRPGTTFSKVRLNDADSEPCPDGPHGSIYACSGPGRSGRCDAA